MHITLVMPTYNGGEFIKEAVASVLKQAHRDWTLLISDDGSKDGTREFLASLDDPRIQVFFQEKNLGIFGNLNFLFAQVRTELTQIFCQDDWLVDEGSLTRLLQAWEALPADVAFMRANHGADGNSALARYELQVLPEIVSPHQSDLFFFLFGCIPGNLSNVSLRTRIVAEHGWFDQRLPYAGDFEFWSRVGSRERWAISRTSVAHIRQHPGQASANLNKVGELLPQLATVLGGLYARLRSRGVSALRLKLACTVCYECQHRWVGLNNWRHTRSWLYLQKVHQHLSGADFTLGPLSGWLAFIGSAGGRLGRVASARWLLSSRARAT